MLEPIQKIGLALRDGMYQIAMLELFIIEPAEEPFEVLPLF